MKTKKIHAFSFLLTLLVLFGLSGCVTTTTIDEGDGVVMEEEKPLMDQVEIER